MEEGNRVRGPVQISEFSEHTADLRPAHRRIRTGTSIDAGADVRSGVQPVETTRPVGRQGPIRVHDLRPGDGAIRVERSLRSDVVAQTASPGETCSRRGGAFEDRQREARLRVGCDADQRVGDPGAANAAKERRRPGCGRGSPPRSRRRDSSCRTRWMRLPSGERMA